MIDAELRPRLRGVFHQWAFVAAVAAGAVLVVLADGPREIVSSWVYAAALAAMFGASALYHRFPHLQEVFRSGSGTWHWSSADDRYVAST